MSTRPGPGLLDQDTPRAALESPQLTLKPLFAPNFASIVRRRIGKNNCLRSRGSRQQRSGLRELALFCLVVRLFLPLVVLAALPQRSFKGVLYNALPTEQLRA